MRIEPDLISRIKEAQKEDSEIWTIVENLDKQVEFHRDDDNVLWQDTRLVVPNDVSLREALLTEAHSSPFSVHPGSTKMYHDLKQHFWWSGMKRDVATFVASLAFVVFSFLSWPPLWVADQLEAALTCMTIFVAVGAVFISFFYRFGSTSFFVHTRRTIAPLKGHECSRFM
nr:retrotransposon protein, putative, Ty3-gypsy subclass [Tanacetum cinerariifolium]